MRLVWIQLEILKQALGQPRIPIGVKSTGGCQKLSSAERLAGKVMLSSTKTMFAATFRLLNGTSPRTCKSPAVGSKYPAIILRSVVLSAPLGPIRPVIFSPSIVKDRLLTARTLPNCLFNPLLSTTMKTGLWKLLQKSVKNTKQTSLSGIKV